MMGTFYLKTILLLLILNTAAIGISSKLGDKVLPLSRETIPTAKRRILNCHPRWGCNFPNSMDKWNYLPTSSSNRPYNRPYHPFRYNPYLNRNPWDQRTPYDRGSPDQRGRRSLATEATQNRRVLLDTHLEAKRFPFDSLQSKRRELQDWGNYYSRVRFPIDYNPNWSEWYPFSSWSRWRNAQEVVNQRPRWWTPL